MKDLEENKKEQEEKEVIEENTESQPEEQTEQPKKEEALSDIEKAIKEKEEAHARLQRLQADFENFRKRNAKERVELLNSANSELVGSLLPVLDNFQRALNSQEGSKFKEGIEMIIKQFKDILEREGLKEIDCLNQPFDPNFHEAVIQVEEDDKPENTVVEVLQTGYTFKDKVLRPAMVKVNK